MAPSQAASSKIRTKAEQKGPYHTGENQCEFNTLTIVNIFFFNSHLKSIVLFMSCKLKLDFKGHLNFGNKC